MIKLAIGGYKGRMGQRLISLAKADSRFNITGEYDQEAGTSEHDFDVLVDFSTPDGTMKFLPLCKHQKAALVIGTTGHSPEQLRHIDEIARQIPILKASNFSIGVNLLFDILPTVAKELTRNFDAEIVETHHTGKADAPSGTALALLEAILSATSGNKDHDVIYGRHGQVGTKPKRQIGLHAVRSGDVIGKHEIIFGGVGESITITHEAHSRDTFAKGALEGAAWLVNKPPRLYNMKDILEDRL